MLMSRTKAAFTIDGGFQPTYIGIVCCSAAMELLMRHDDHDGHSPLKLLMEVAVEGTSSLVEAQRTLLDLSKQENEIFFNGVKERIANFVPGVAMTDLVRRSLDTLIGMQQELLTSTSKQTLAWLESEELGKSDRAARLMEYAREGVETFTRAQTKLLNVLAEETAKATSGKQQAKFVEKTELSHLAREAANAFIEAQKRLLDVMGQQMNVNLDAATRTAEMISPARVVPMASLTGKEVKDFFNKETSLISSYIKGDKAKAASRPKHPRQVSHAKHARHAKKEKTAV